VSDVLKAPFPWFGGKSRVAPLVWSRFGAVRNYVEPFAGSLAVLLGRPTPFAGSETVNDLDCFLANFWRALAADPQAVAEWCDWPVNEADLHARHRWLVNQTAEFREAMRTDPDYHDAKIAGWWVWGLCQWIGSGWCYHPEWKQLPHLGNAGRGVHRPSQQLPHLGDAGMGDGGHYDYLHVLAARLRRVRVCCGDWRRVLGPTPTTKLGPTGVLLDPPYADTAGRDGDLYARDSLTVAHDVREWAIAHGDDPKMRIALCGYEGEHVMPESWSCVPWKAKGGYASQASHDNPNARRERIWFSPHCIPADEPTLLLT
jgi:DNA adenine methylase